MVLFRITENEPSKMHNVRPYVYSRPCVNLPAIGHMPRTIRNRRRMNQRPGNPANRAAIPEIPMVYQQTANNEQFLLFDSGFGDDNQMLIFASN